MLWLIGSGFERGHICKSLSICVFKSLIRAHSLVRKSFRNSAISIFKFSISLRSLVQESQVILFAFPQLIFISKLLPNKKKLLQYLKTQTNKHER